jgi:hypothetical protein
MKETSKHYIYLHTDSLGVPRYVGKGNNYKRGSSYSRSKFFHNRSKEWNELFSEVKPIIEILEENLTEIEINRKENSWIKYYGMIKDGGTLINILNNLSFLTLKEKVKYWKSKNPELYRNMSRKYDQTHKEQIREIHRKYRLNNLYELRKRSIEYNKQNIDRVRETSKRWDKNNKERRKELAKKYYENNPERTKEVRKRYHEKHKLIRNKTALEYYNKHKEEINRKNREKRLLNKSILNNPL